MPIVHEGSLLCGEEDVVRQRLASTMSQMRKMQKSLGSWPSCGTRGELLFKKNHDLNMSETDMIWIDEQTDNYTD